MKILKLLGLLTFTTGFALKLFHVHYNAYIMMGALVLILVAAIIDLIKQKNLEFLGVFVVLTAFLFTIKFYPYNYPLGIIGLIVGVGIGIFYMWKKKSRLVILGSTAFLCMAFAMPKDELYFNMNIRLNQELDTDLYSGDKYCWFLFNAGKTEESMERCQENLIKAKQLEDDHWVAIIEEHMRKIRSNTWQNYSH